MTQFDRLDHYLQLAIKQIDGNLNQAFIEPKFVSDRVEDFLLEFIPGQLSVITSEPINANFALSDLMAPLMNAFLKLGSVVLLSDSKEDFSDEAINLICLQTGIDKLALTLGNLSKIQWHDVNQAIALLSQKPLSMHHQLSDLQVLSNQLDALKLEHTTLIIRLQHSTIEQLYQHSIWSKLKTKACDQTRILIITPWTVNLQEEQPHHLLEWFDKVIRLAQVRISTDRVSELVFLASNAKSLNRARYTLGFNHNKRCLTHNQEVKHHA